MNNLEKVKKVNILGTKYDLIESDEQHDQQLIGKDGYCDTSVKQCVVDELKQNPDEIDLKKNLHEYKKSVIRHELIHAFLFESGLEASSWADNEEIVDWIAIQFPKLMKAFEEADCL